MSLVEVWAPLLVPAPLLSAPAAGLTPSERERAARCRFPRPAVVAGGEAWTPAARAARVAGAA